MDTASHKEPSPGPDGLATAGIPVNWPAVILFFLESYHVFTHVAILFGLRMLPRKDLVRQRFYFLFDTLTIFTVNFVFLGQLRWLAALQMCQHFSYFIWWDSAEFCRRVISWSSLDWNYSYEHRFDWGLIIGTTFDLVCHLINACLLYSGFLSLFHAFVALVVTILSFVVIFYNPRLAWSSPLNVPDWVRKRCIVLEEPYVDIKKIGQ